MPEPSMSVAESAICLSAGRADVAKTDATLITKAAARMSAKADGF